jgi:protoheme IX farnesyltransferase
MGSMQLVYNYGVLLKPKVLLAMLALYLITFFTSTSYSGGISYDGGLFIIGFLAVAFAVSGANALNCYIDRDIDSVMTRTSGRPLALGTISSNGALGFSGVMMMVATALAISLGTLPFLLLVEGAGSYLLLYTLILKRRSSVNVLSTAPSVAAPAWLGWYLGGAPLYPLGLLMGLIVAVWGPLHLWSIAYVYAKDYTRVGVPMMPTVVPKEEAIRWILIALGFLLGSSYLLTPWAGSLLYSVGVTVVNIPLILVGINLYSKKSNKSGWLLFKMTAPYIIIVFLLFLVSHTL